MKRGVAIGAAVGLAFGGGYAAAMAPVRIFVEPGVGVRWSYSLNGTEYPPAIPGEPIVVGAVNNVVRIVVEPRPFDVDGDGKTGLQEAIHALRVVAGR